MSKRAAQMTYEEVLQNPPWPKALEQEEFTIPDLLMELVEETGMSYQDLGKLLGGMSMYQAGRVARGDIPFTTNKRITHLATKTGWPFHRLLIANAKGELDQRSKGDGKKKKPDKELQKDLKLLEKAAKKQSPQLKEGEVRVHGDIVVPKQAWPKGFDINGKLEAMRQFSTEIITMPPVPFELEENEMLVQMHGTHMMNAKVPKHFIQDGSYLLVRAMRDQDIDNNDLVYAQLGRARATVYLFLRIKGADKSEVFKSTANRSPSFPIHPTMKEPVKNQRIIFGKVKWVLGHELG